MHWKLQSPSSPTVSLTPASGTEKLFRPAPSAASAALPTELQGLGVPMLADDSDEAAEEDSDAAEDEAAEEDSDAAEEDADADEAELLLALTLLLLVELHEQPTMPTASTAAKAMTSTFLYMMVPPLQSMHLPAGCHQVRIP